MPTVDITLPHHRYQVHIEPGCLANLADHIAPLTPHHNAALFADTAVYDTHAQPAIQSLTNADFTLTTHRLTCPESEKNLDSARKLYDVLVSARTERTWPVIAMGGGVIGDTAGFVAATYLRGLPLIQCPTTLLAMVDASVGGKVGVNLPQGKNLVGCFYQPHRVVIDTDTLATLPPRELRCGLAECVKHAAIRDADLFDWIDQRTDAIQNLDRDTIVELVACNVRIKAAVVMADEKEAGQRAHLNFGHTFAHAIEVTTGYGRDGASNTTAFHHGEAVSLGMVAAANLAATAGHCDTTVPTRMTALLKKIGLPTTAPDLPPTDTLLSAMRLDKKVAAGTIRLVLPTRIGAVDIHNNIPDTAITTAWDSLRHG